MNFDIKNNYLKYSEIKMCRVCENSISNTLISLYNTEKKNILNNLKQIIEVKIESENDLPKYICMTCLTNLDVTIKFIKQCKDTELKLIKSMENRKQQIEKSTIVKPDWDDPATEEDESNEVADDLFLKNEEHMENLLVSFTSVLKDIETQEIKKEPETDQLNVSKKPQLIQCPNCNQKFNNLHESLLHIKQKCEQLFQCEECDNFFKSEKQLKYHLKLKHKPSVIKCDLCEKIFKNGTNMLKHTKEVHKKEKNYFCDTCGKGFFSISPLRVHRESHKPQSERLAIKKKKQYANNNMKHMICEYCGKDFQKVSTYYNHLTTHNKNSKGGQANLKCLMCNYTASRTQLRDHIRVHTGEKPFDCKECSSKFRTLPQLKIHENAVHLGEKKYECNICGKRLGYKFSYDAHMNRHAGNANYKCNLCPMKFFEPRPLRIHKQKCHDLVNFENSDNLLQK